MKKFVFITGALSFSLTSVGVLFKIMHWPGAGVLIVLGIALFSVLFVPFFANYLYKNTN